MQVKVNFRSISEQFQSSFRAVSGRFQFSSGVISGQFQGSFRAVSSWFQVDFKLISSWFQLDFNWISSWFRSVWGQLSSDAWLSWRLPWKCTVNALKPHRGGELPTVNYPFTPSSMSNSIIKEPQQSSRTDVNNQLKSNRNSPTPVPTAHAPPSTRHSYYYRWIKHWDLPSLLEDQSASVSLSVSRFHSFLNDWANDEWKWIGSAFRYDAVGQRLSNVSQANRRKRRQRPDTSAATRATAATPWRALVFLPSIPQHFSASFSIPLLQSICFRMLKDAWGFLRDCLWGAQN